GEAGARGGWGVTSPGGSQARRIRPSRSRRHRSGRAASGASRSRWSAACCTTTEYGTPSTTSGTAHPDLAGVFDSRGRARYRAGAPHQNVGRERPQRGGLMMNRFRWTACAFALVATLASATGDVLAQGTIKIAYTDPLSGPFAQVGDQNLQQFKYIIDWINGRGGALGKKFELVAFDNKSQPSDALLALKSATD